MKDCLMPKAPAAAPLAAGAFAFCPAVNYFVEQKVTKCNFYRIS